MSRLFSGRRPPAATSSVPKKSSNDQTLDQSQNTGVPVNVAASLGPAPETPTAPSPLAPFSSSILEKQVSVLVQKLEDKARSTYLLARVAFVGFAD